MTLWKFCAEKKYTVHEIIIIFHLKKRYISINDDIIF